MSYFIYKLVCDDCDDFYVGSTKSIKDRKYKHKHKAKKDPSKKYQIIRDNGGWENWRMVVLEECDESIKTKLQAEMREETFRLELKATMNTKRARRTDEVQKQLKSECDKRYREKYSEELKEKNKEKWIRNRETILAERRDDKVTCVCGCQVSKNHIARHMKTAKHLNLMEQKNENEE
tara:strand:+ start:277 stop:810 length:534 start_codon:yes stop_codon:yes gene_type:complete